MGRVASARAAILDSLSKHILDLTVYTPELISSPGVELIPEVLIYA